MHSWYNMLCAIRPWVSFSFNSGFFRVKGEEACLCFWPVATFGWHCFWSQVGEILFDYRVAWAGFPPRQSFDTRTWGIRWFFQWGQSHREQKYRVGNNASFCAQRGPSLCRSSPEVHSYPRFCIADFSDGLMSWVMSKLMLLSPLSDSFLYILFPSSSFDIHRYEDRNKKVSIDYPRIGQMYFGAGSL